MCSYLQHTAVAAFIVLQAYSYSDVLACYHGHELAVYQHYAKRQRLHLKFLCYIKLSEVKIAAFHWCPSAMYYQGND